MCGVIGFSTEELTQKQLNSLQIIMIESSIRGKHASGIAWYEGVKLRHIIKPYSIDILVRELNWDMFKIGEPLKLIAHARYSTSDLEFNQPIIVGNTAIVHNGVITQSPPELWKEKFGYECTGRNDSELLLRCIDNNENPFEKFPESSISAIYLRNGELIAMRNGLRPLWKGELDSGTFYASTRDILQRGKVQNITKLEMQETKGLHSEETENRTLDIKNSFYDLELENINKEQLNDDW